MEQIDLKHLIEQYPEVLIDSAKLKSYILDLYPSSKRGIVNVLVAIQQCGIVAEMQTSKNSSALDMSRWKKVLDDDYGFTGETAETCLQMWCSAVGVQLEIKASAEQKANTVRSKVQNDNSQNKQSSVEVGDIYKFGTYKQDNTAKGKEPIEWIVLAKEGDKILIVSDKALDCKQYTYHVVCSQVTWKGCFLRGWLNSTFLNEAFSNKEQNCIVSTSVSADINPIFKTRPGDTTIDKVFLLSIVEVEKYFRNDKSRKCIPTAYAKANKVLTSGTENCWWWLRSSGNEESSIALVKSDGCIYYVGLTADFEFAGVRPALWISECKLREKVESERREQERKAKEAQEQWERKAREEKERRERELAEAKRREERKRLEQQRLALEKERREKGVCQHCGGDFRGLFMKKCAVCGQRKDY